MDFTIEVSARHVHLTQQHLEVLFGKDHKLTFQKELSQPGQFLALEKVQLKNNDRSISNVSILGPCRIATQVELSKTDCISLRLDAVIRDSGNIESTPGVTLVGPKGEVVLDKGVIVAQRHLHITPEEALKLGLKDKQTVSVKPVTTNRGVIFGDVLVRVSPAFALAMHIDTDEANAANILKNGTTGTIV